MMTFRRRGDAIDHAQCEAERTGRSRYVMWEREQWAVRERFLWGVPCEEIAPHAYRQVLNGVAQRGVHSANRPK